MTGWDHPLKRPGCSILDDAGRVVIRMSVVKFYCEYVRRLRVLLHR